MQAATGAWEENWHVTCRFQGEPSRIETLKMKKTFVSDPSALVSKLNRDEGGATAVEYAIMASVMGLMILGAASHLGASLEQTYNGIAAALSDEPNMSANTR
jgi:pilus assembly protein Flp/PilA